MENIHIYTHTHTHMSQIISSIFSNKNIIAFGNVSIFFGISAFYFGIICNTINLLFEDPNLIEEEYILPPQLKMSKNLIVACEESLNIIYGAIINGFIGFTWPVSLPLIKYLYKKPKSQNISSE